MIPNSLVAVPHRPNAKGWGGRWRKKEVRRWGCWCFRNLVKQQGCRQLVLSSAINIDKVPTWFGDFEHQQQLKASNKKSSCKMCYVLRSEINTASGLQDHKGLGPRTTPGTAEVLIVEKLREWFCVFVASLVLVSCFFGVKNLEKQGKKQADFIWSKAIFSGDGRVETNQPYWIYHFHHTCTVLEAYLGVSDLITSLDSLIYFMLFFFHISYFWISGFRKIYSL